MTPTRSAASAVAGMLGVVVVLVLVTWAASIGPDEVLRKPGPPAGSTFIPNSSSSAQLGPRFDPPPPHASGPAPTWLRVSGTLVEALALLLLVALLVRLVIHLRERWVNRRRRPTRDRPEVDFDVIGEPGALAEALTADAAEQRRQLEEGEPRNAIVACWHRLEVTAERAGARRRTWQTPSEFVLAVLELAGADGEGVLALAALYREARFSDHPLTEEHRAAALAALEQTRVSVARRARTAPAVPS